MNKKRLTVAASLVLAIALVIVGTTMTYLTSRTEPKVNNFGVGTLTTDIHENDQSTPESVNSIPINFTDKAPKQVAVENAAGKDAIDAYVRVQLVPSFRDTNGVNLGGDFAMAEPSDNKIVFTPFTDKDLTITLAFDDHWSGSWFYVADDNCFYYKTIVAPGHRTDVLLEEVQFSGADAAGWKDKFNLDVLTDSIQAGGRAASDAWTNINITEDSQLARH